MFLNGYHPDGNDRYVGENSKHASQSQRTWVKKLIEAGMLKFDADNMPLEHLKAANPTAYYLDPRTPAGERQAFFKKVAERNREIQRRNQSEQEDREAQRTRRLRNVAAISLARPGPRSPNENKMITDALIHNKPGSYYDAIRFADQARRSRNSDAAPTRSSINFQREERAEPETTSKLPQTPSATINPFLLQRAETLVRAFLKDGDRGAPLRARAAELSIEELELALEIAPPEQRSFRAGLKNYIKERELSSVLYKEFAEKGSANLSGLRPRELAAIKRMATDVAHVTQHAGAQNFLKWLEQTV